MNTSVAVLLGALIMGILLFAAVFIGLRYSKKSAQKLRESREKENRQRKK